MTRGLAVNNQRFRTVFVMLVLLGLIVGSFWPVVAKGAEVPPLASTPAESFKPGEILIKVKSGVSAAWAEDAMERYGVTSVEPLNGLGVVLWQVPEGSELEMVQRLNADPAVEYAEPNYIYYALGTPNDPYYGEQWAHANVHSAAAWDITTGSTGVTIAIIDTGIDAGHPDLAGKVVAGYDYVDGDSDPRDLNGHGTHVAGIAAAMTNNAVGIAGMDWQARIMPVRVLDVYGQGYNSDITQGIYWAYQHGAKVLNLSLGGTSYSLAMQEVINAAHEAGSLVVAAMGNCRTGGSGCPGVNPTTYPAAYDNVMAVAATGPEDLYAPYSQYGLHCDIAAPGGDMTYLHDPDGVFSTMPTYSVYMTSYYGYSTNYDFVQGTSQATPHVAGLAALIWSMNLSQSPGAVQDIIQSTATDLPPAGWDVNYGYGRIDALAALTSATPPEAPILLPIENADGNGTYWVDWNDVPSATGYQLQEDDNAAFSSPALRYSGTNSQYQVVGRDGGIWYYRVRATSDFGNSSWSNIQSVGVKPAAPVLESIDNAGNEDEYQVSWSMVNGATGYVLEEDDNASFSDPLIRYVGTSLQYNVTGQPGGTWYYRVRAYNSVGDGPWSNTESTMVDPPALEAPVLEPIDNDDGDGDFDVIWSDVPTTPVTYTLEASDDPYFSDPSTVYSGTTSQYSVVDQPRGTWHYRVRAFGRDGKSPWSNQESAVVMTYIYLPVVVTNHEPVLPSDWVTIVNEDFEGPFPGSWEVRDDGANGGTYYWGSRSCLVYDGDFAGWAVGGGDGEELLCGSEYQPDVDSWMIYGPFSLSGTVAAEFGFELWMNTDSSSDRVCRLASTDGIVFDGTCTWGYSNGWVEKYLDLAAVPNLGDLTGHPDVWVALRFVSDDSTAFGEGAFVDGITVRKCVGAMATTSMGRTVIDRDGLFEAPASDWLER
jgi:thermitase